MAALLSFATSTTFAQQEEIRGVDDAIQAGIRGDLPAAKPFRLAVIPVEFPDQARDPRFTTKDLDAMLFSRGGAYRRSPSGDEAFGSLADYYAENSSGRLELSGRVFDWVKIRRPRAKLSGVAPEGLLGSMSWWMAPVAHVTFMTQVLSAVEAANGGRRALAGFDGVAFVIAGETGPHRSFLWPHSFGTLWRGRLLRYYLMSELTRGEFASIGVHAHELGHVFGILDKYGEGRHAGLGTFCTMATGHRGDRANGDRRPLHLCAWCKERLGWLAPITVDPRVRQTIRLRPIEGAPGEAVKVLVDPDGSEYFLLENRRRSGFDAGIAGPGLLIWHVGELGQRLRNRVYGYDIDLEEAHGDETRAGPFRDLEKAAWPQPGKTAFTPWTRPGSTSWNLSALPVAITGIRRDGDDVIFTIDPAAARSDSGTVPQWPPAPPGPSAAAPR